MLILILAAPKTHAQRSFLKNADSIIFTRSLSVLPQNFYNQHMGFMCKKESQLQKLANLNLFVRLGTKAYVDYLEQKPNAKAY